MNLDTFVRQHDVDHSNSRIDVPTLEQAEKTIGIKFGDELTEYLLKYGYLGFEYVELYGMNARQGLNSDLVTQTQYMHKYYPDTSSLIARAAAVPAPCPPTIQGPIPLAADWALNVAEIHFPATKRFPTNEVRLLNGIS